MYHSKSIRSQDIKNIYKTAIKESFKWEECIPNAMKDFISLLWRGFCCPPDLVMPSLLCTAASLAGPRTKIECHKDGNKSPVILYVFAITVPGGGKTTTFEKVIVPGSEVFLAEAGKALLIENYTHAGMQTHQFETGGYGLLTSDEGARVISAVEGKQAKHEGERQFLCKAWTGQGDYTFLREQERGYPSTALSMLLFIQPHPLFMLLRNFQTDDGLLDRILFIVSKPYLFVAEIISRSASQFTERFGDVVRKMYKIVYDAHKNKDTVYRFDTEAQIYYNEISDGIVAEFNKQFDSDSDDEPLIFSQVETKLTTSKDVIQIPRLAAALHLVFESFDRAITGHERPIPEEIDLVTIKIAHRFYYTTLKQKSVMIEAVTQNTKDSQIGLREVLNTNQKVQKAVYKYPGPFTFPREIQKHLSDVNASMLREELMTLTTKGLGNLKKRGENGIWKETFFKIPPNNLPTNHPSFEVAGMTHAVYTKIFKDTSKLKGRDQRLLEYHPNETDFYVSFNDNSDVESTNSNVLTIPLSSQSISVRESVSSGSIGVSLSSNSNVRESQVVGSKRKAPNVGANNIDLDIAESSDDIDNVHISSRKKTKHDKVHDISSINGTSGTRNSTSSNTGGIVGKVSGEVRPTLNQNNPNSDDELSDELRCSQRYPNTFVDSNSEGSKSPIFNTNIKKKKDSSHAIGLNEISEASTSIQQGVLAKVPASTKINSESTITKLLTVSVDRDMVSQHVKKTNETVVESQMIGSNVSHGLMTKDKHCTSSKSSHVDSQWSQPKAWISVLNVNKVNDEYVDNSNPIVPQKKEHNNVEKNKNETNNITQPTQQKIGVRKKGKANKNEKTYSPPKTRSKNKSNNDND